MPEVIITGLPAALEAVSPARFVTGIRTGSEELGQAIAAETRTLLGGHRYTGRLDASIEVVQRTTGAGVTTTIGVNDREVPEAGAISYGWRGHGHQPPAEELGRWAQAHGIGSGMAPARIGFVLARAIKARGYSFGPVRPFERAWEVVRTQTSAIIGSAIGRARG